MLQSAFRFVLKLRSAQGSILRPLFLSAHLEAVWVLFLEFVRGPIEAPFWLLAKAKGPKRAKSGKKRDLTKMKGKIQTAS